MPEQVNSNHMPILIAQVDTPQDRKSGDFHYRTYAPSVGMAMVDGTCVVNLSSIHPSRDDIMRDADVLVLNNLCDPDLLPVIEQRKRQRGKLTVYELNDALEEPPADSPVACFYQDDRNSRLLKKLASYCDMLQFSTEELRKRYGHLNPRHVVFPNQILHIPSERKFARKPQVIIGWGGSQGHREDLGAVAPALMQWIMSRENIQLHLMCAPSLWEFFDELPVQKKRHFNTGSMESYSQFLSQLDIGIAPLLDTPFNRSRSDVKFLEYAIHGVVPVMQALAPYSQSVDAGKTGFLFDSPETLTSTLDSLCNDLSRRVGIAISARHYVLSERLERQHSRRRVEIYRHELQRLGFSRSAQETQAFNRRMDVYGSLAEPGPMERYLPLAITAFEECLYQGARLCQAGRRHEARPLLETAVTLEPRSHLPHLYGAGVLEDPITSLTRALSKKPDSVHTNLLLGDVLLNMGNAARALHHYLTAKQLFPQYELPFLKDTHSGDPSELDHDGVTV